MGLGLLVFEVLSISREEGWPACDDPSAASWLSDRSKISHLWKSPCSQWSQRYPAIGRVQGAKKSTQDPEGHTASVLSPTLSQGHLVFYLLRKPVISQDFSRNDAKPCLREMPTSDRIKHLQKPAWASGNCAHSFLATAAPHPAAQPLSLVVLPDTRLTSFPKLRQHLPAPGILLASGFGKRSRAPSEFSDGLTA